MEKLGKEGRCEIVLLVIINYRPLPLHSSYSALNLFQTECGTTKLEQTLSKVGNLRDKNDNFRLENHLAATKNFTISTHNQKRSELSKQTAVNVIVTKYANIWWKMAKVIEISVIKNNESMKELREVLASNTMQELISSLSSIKKSSNQYMTELIDQENPTTPKSKIHLNFLVKLY